MVELECPLDRQPNDCEAAQSAQNAFRCPISRAPYHLRKGFIAAMGNAGVSSGTFEQRCGLSKEVQDRHDHLPNSGEERQRYDDAFRHAAGDGSGYGG